MAEGDYSDTRTVDKNGDAVVVRIEDDRTGMHPVTLERAVFDHLHYTCSKEQDTATLRDAYEAVAHSVRDRLVHRWIATQRAYNAEDAKRVYYISAEFLLGRALANNLISLGLYKVANRLLRRRGIHLGDLLEQEPDPGLGNGGLGRLAACFLDSMATLGLPGYGYGIRYEFGIFEQEFVDGAQVEHPDNWLRYGTPWEFPRYEYTVPVDFYGKTERRLDDNGRLRSYWVDTKRVHGVPYDTPIAGFGTLTVNTLRLWSARASQELDLVVFNDGDYRRAVEEKTISESISKVLYPKDQSEEGKELRLKQQYFFVCCSIRDIVRRYKSHHKDFRAFPDKVAIQLNDTHPAVAIPELMRLLVDEEGLRWDAAWDITRRTFAFTNHTLLSEALERWPVSTFGRLLPRHLEIIYEINHHFLGDIHVLFPEDEDRQRRMSVIEEGPEKQIRMAHLAVIGSHSVNGVAELHSRLVRTSLLKDFAEAWPDRFNNKTNGVTQRRWVLLANPRLATAITERIGRGWITDLSQLEQLLPLADDEG
ncbi:MAG: glycogen/starch/alpha-glucan family phosphorylase, partial [Planctomycetota bacterium]